MQAASSSAAELAELQSTLDAAKSQLAQYHVDLVSARGEETQAQAAAVAACQQGAVAATQLADLQSALDSAKADLAHLRSEVR